MITLSWIPALREPGCNSPPNKVNKYWSGTNIYIPRQRQSEIWCMANSRPDR